jgi:uncharacterized sporulation protein YeaH/YhbH (DUF444 family)
MSNIIDKRRQKDHSARDRRRFVRRVKEKLKDQVDKAASKSDLKDVVNGKTKVKVRKKDISEPDIGYDPSRSNAPIIVSGNDSLGRGDTIPKPPQGGGQGTQGSDSGEGEDDFMFTLTKEEFADILFSDMALPDFIKQAIAKGIDFRWKKAGVIKDGMPSRLNVKKTMEQAIGRRLANKSGNAPYLDDVDLRYDHRVKEPKPIRHAVMFLALDVSGSMCETLKDYAKRFFLMLYLFLERSYDSVDLRFIRFTHEAREVDEEEFFDGRDSGGTCCSKALELIKQIMDKDYDLDETNIYIAQASDGEDFDIPKVAETLESQILPYVQYYAYAEVRRGVNPYWKTIAQELTNTVFETYKNAKASTITSREEVYPALHDLFKKETSE